MRGEGFEGKQKEGKTNTHTALSDGFHVLPLTSGFLLVYTGFASHPAAESNGTRSISGLSPDCGCGILSDRAFAKNRISYF